jgi:glycosyltransferase involved in cell wall biosynthesis
MVSLKLAILGTRGVPPRYGGFETFAGELSRRLVARRHQVTVYCRAGRPGFSPATDDAGLKPGLPASWHGVHRITLPAIRHKYLETVSHTFLSALDALRRDFDAVLLCNAANAFVLPLLRAARIPVAINVDGIERRRRKWNALGRAVYAAGETFSALFADHVVADADVIAAYYRDVHQVEPVMIPYGAEFPEEEDSDVLQRLRIEAGRYLLYVSRFEPENNPLEVVKAYEKLAVGSWQLAEASVNGQLPTVNIPLVPLVMLGSAAYAADLDAELRRHAGPHILFPGALYGRDYRTLQRNALLYIQATEVGGTHPAMIEAMASGGCVVALDTPENREVGGDAVRYFDLGPNQTLSGTLSKSVASPALRESMRAAARARAGELYSWERVTDAYEQLLAELAD